MIKTISTSIILVFIITISFGQNYFNESSIWHQKKSSWSPTTEIEHNFQYYFNGDTLINNITYSKIFKIGTKITINDITTIPVRDTIHFNEFINSIREENNKVFHFRHQDTVETLLYDFDLTIGDTVGNNLIVDSIEYIDFANQQRKRFHLKSFTTWVQGYLIEGIGFERGLFEYPAISFEGSQSLICYTQSNSVLLLGENQDCNFLVINSVDQLKKNLNFKIWPNPSFKVYDFEEIVNLKITSIDGQICKAYNKVRLNENVIELDIKELPSGIYFLSLQKRDAIKTIKFIKKN